MRFAADWSEAALLDVARSDAPIGYGIVQTGPYVKNGIPVLAIRDLRRPSMRNAHRSSPQIEAAYRRSRIRGGDILISVKGTTGRIGLVPEGFDGNISRDVARVRLRDEHDPGFWYQLLQSSEAQQVLQLAAVGTTRQELSIGTLKRLRFRFPSKATQLRIERVLADLDSQIATIERLIVKKQAILQGMMQQLLTGRTRLSGFENPWREMSVGQLATITKGQQLGRANLDSQHGVPVWNGGIVPSGYTSSPNVHRAVVTVSEGGNSCGWVGRPGGRFWLGGHCYALDPKPAGHSVGYLYHALKEREPMIKGLRVGSGLPNIQKNDLSEFVVHVPSDPEEARVIARILDDAGNEIATLRARLHKSRSIKIGMMQELFTGRTRLPIEEAES